MLNLTSVYLKVRRAEDLLHALDVEVDAWQNLKPYSTFTKFNAEYTRASLVVRVHHEPPATHWSLIIADIFHNLRCGLDHLIWAMACMDSPSGVPKDDKITFPIWDFPPNSNNRKKIASLPDRMKVAIGSVQPYSRPFPDWHIHPLSILRDIDNMNKHQLLKSAFPSFAKATVRVTATRKDNPESPDTKVHTGEIKDGTELVVTTFKTAHPDMKYEIERVMCIIALQHPFADSLGRDRDDYATLLDTIIRIVKLTVEMVAQQVP